MNTASLQPSASHLHRNLKENLVEIDENILQNVGSSNYGRLFGSHDIHSSHPMKRALPASFQPSTSKPRPYDLIENVGASEIRETYGKTAWSNPNGGRLLPSTLMPLMPGKHSSTTPFVGLNDSSHQTGVGEERPAGTDESYVFQAAVQVLVSIVVLVLSSLVTILSYKIKFEMRACSLTVVGGGLRVCDLHFFGPVKQ